MKRLSTASRAIWRDGLTAAALTAVLNLAIFAAGRATGVTFVVPGWGPGAPATQVPADHVAIMSIVFVLAGTAVMVLVAPRRGARLIQVAGVTLGLLSVGGPLSMEADGGTRVLLAAMHITTAIAFAVVSERARRKVPRPHVGAPARAAATARS